MNNFINPMLGLDMNEEQKRRMLGMALLSGGAAAAQNVGKGFMPSFGSGVQAMMGSLDSQQQMALMAQMQGLQRKNITSQMEARTHATEMADKEMGMKERELGMRQQGYDLQEKQYKLQERNAARQAAEAQRKDKLFAERQAEADKINEMMQNPETKDRDIAEALTTFHLKYGGQTPGNAQNVLMPSGIRQSPFEQMMMGAMMGQMPGAPAAGGNPLAGGMQPGQPSMEQTQGLQMLQELASGKGDQIIGDMLSFEAKDAMDQIQAVYPQLPTEARAKADLIYQKLLKRYQRQKSMSGTIQRQ